MQKNGRFDGSQPGPGRDKVYTPEKLEEIAGILEEWLERVIRKKASFFWTDFAAEKGYTPESMSRWAKQSERFNEVYQRVRQYQKIRIAEEALKNNFNSNFSQFYLKAHFREDYGDVSVNDKQIVYNNTYYSDKPPLSWEEEQKQANLN